MIACALARLHSAVLFLSGKDSLLRGQNPTAIVPPIVHPAADNVVTFKGRGK
ncbi:hypothetical protein [Brevundimonas pondensis]|uniref:Uncharacterized protein n=1 Tax=Brevundimonas pondensis TaxID=2774189 RepID=A0ABX7SMR6_9CAUL|nr:hypothetical protein [Brevundimonas pondensis]QTC88085.1 hypothetical protein IFE19_01365 [Brevundimonas pondensis]